MKKKSETLISLEKQLDLLRDKKEILIEENRIRTEIRKEKEEIEKLLPKKKGLFGKIRIVENEY